VNDALKGYLALASGLTEVTKARATAAAKALVAQGEAAAGQVQTIADDLIAQSRSNREAVTALVKFEVDKALGRVGLASADEVTELTARVRQLEAQLREARSGSAKAPATKAPATKAPAKKAPAKKAAAKKAPAKKAAPKSNGA
jgi:polyhydroxyalkanoate synthesis regulator phasin